MQTLFGLLNHLGVDPLLVDLLDLKMVGWGLMALNYSGRLPYLMGVHDIAPGKRYLGRTEPYAQVHDNSNMNP